MDQPDTQNPSFDNLELCQQAIGYRFKDTELLLSALSHSSIKAEGGDSNERLEFLGDAVLGLVVCRDLFDQFPDYTEGDLTHIKSSVVSRHTLALLARKLSLQDHLLLGKGMAGRKSLPPSVLANVMEAVIAAVYLDGGLEPARELILRLLGDEIAAVEAMREPHNYKSLLQQYTQRHRGCAPTYQVIEQTGPDHRKTFHVAAVIDGRECGVGNGRNKKEAEQAAAKTTLEQLEAEDAASGRRQGRAPGIAREPGRQVERARRRVDTGSAPSGEHRPGLLGRLIDRILRR